MSKLIRLSHSKIEYIINPDGSRGYSWGIFSGCCNHLVNKCGGDGKDFNCWTRSITHRFRNHYPQGFSPYYYPEAINSPMYLKKPSRIAVGWVGDIIGYGLQYKEQIYNTIKACPQHIFLFLTKNHDRLVNWENFPDNCWVGQTVTNQGDADRTFNDFAKVEATVKYLSLEPLLGKIDISPYLRGWVNAGTTFENPEGVERYDVDGALVNHIHWLIIGGQTRPTVMPKIEWVREIVEAADKAGIPVFLKNNLERLAFDFKPPETDGKIEKFWCLFDRIDHDGEDLIIGADMRQEIPE